MATKSQHTVPRLHLQHFAGATPKGQVWTYDSQNGKSWPKIPEETGTETHFYSVKREDGTHDTRIEDMLAAIESRAAPVYEAMLIGAIPATNTQVRVYFAEFLAMLYMRTSAMRRMNAEVQSHGIQAMQFAYAQDDHAFEKVMSAVEKERGEPIPGEIREQVRQSMLDPSRFEIVIPKERTLHALGAADKLAPILYRMKWSLAHPEQGVFITSDNPVVRQVDPATRHPVLGDHGFLNKTAEVTFPLSTKVMFIASWDQTARDFGAFEGTHVRYLNEARAAHSERFLYADSNQAWISDLAAKYREKGSRVSVDGFGPAKTAKTKVGRN